MFEKLKVRKAAKRRDHQLSPEDELLLLKSCGDDIIRHYVHKYSFGDDAEEFMLDNSSNAVLKSYFKRYPVAPELEYKVLEKGLNTSYIDQHGLNEDAQRALILSGNEWLCDYYVKTAHSFDGDVETLFVETASDELMEKYLKYNDLSEEVLKILVNKDAKWLLVYAKNNKLPEKFETAFVHAASDEEFDAYIEDYSFNLEACLMLLEDENREKLRRYIAKHSLVSDYPMDDSTAEEKLFQSEDKALISEYINFHTGEISENGEMELLFSDNDELVKSFIDKAGRFFSSTEEELIQSNKDEIFNYYVERYKFSEENEALLVRSGKKERIEAYIQKYALCPMAENLLILGGNKELIKDYHKKWELRDSSWKVLLENFFLENW